MSGRSVVKEPEGGHIVGSEASLERTYDAILDELKRRIKYGDVGRVARRLNRGRNFLSDWRRGRSLIWGELLETLELLDAHPVEFFEQAVGRADAGRPRREIEGAEGLLARTKTMRVRELLAVLEALATSPVELMEAFCGTAEPRLPQEAAAVWRLYSEGGGSVARTPDPKLDRAWLEDLDRRRYDDPAGVLRETLAVSERIHELPRELDVLYLGVTGSAYRLRGWQREEIEQDMARARKILELGLWIAQRLKDGAGETDLLARRSYVLADQGNHARALELAERASGVALRLNDPETLGKALVVQGTWLYALDRPEDAIRTEETGLQLLPTKCCRRWHATAYDILGLSHRRLRRSDKALACARRASQLSKGAGAAFEGKALWLLASLQADNQSYSEAAATLGRVVTVFLPVHLGEVALATVELVRVQLLRGDPRAACEAALSLWAPPLS